MKLDKRLQNKSREIVKALRHTPELYKLTLDEEGYANISSILKEFNITATELQLIVSQNDKKRLEFDSDLEYLRAAQGHSIDVNLEESLKRISLNDINGPVMYYHGSSISNIDAILENGIHRMKRNYVHLSKDKETAINVAKRHANSKGEKSVVIFEIEAKKLINTLESNGFGLYESSNSVILAYHIPPSCLSNMSIEFLVKEDPSYLDKYGFSRNAIISNKIMTPDGTVLHSKHVHDYVSHDDKNSFYYSVDGGTEYLKRSFDPNAPKALDLSIHETDQFFVIREHARWGTRGPNGDQPLTFVKLSKMSDNHILNVLLTQTRISKLLKGLLINELWHRLENSITIKETENVNS